MGAICLYLGCIQGVFWTSLRELKNKSDNKLSALEASSCFAYFQLWQRYRPRPFCLPPSLLGAGLDLFFQHLRGLGAGFRVMAQFLGHQQQLPEAPEFF